MIKTKWSNKWTRSIYSLTLYLHVMNLCRLMWKIYSTYAIKTKMYLNRSLYWMTRSPYWRPILSTFMGCWWNQTSQRHRKIHSLWHWLFQFHQRPINAEKMGIQYRDLFSEVFVCLALISTSNFRSYVCRLVTLWFCYIPYKVFSPNSITCWVHLMF